MDDTFSWQKTIWVAQWYRLCAMTLQLLVQVPSLAIKKYSWHCLASIAECSQARLKEIKHKLITLLSKAVWKLHFHLQSNKGLARRQGSFGFLFAGWGGIEFYETDESLTVHFFFIAYLPFCDWVWCAEYQCSPSTNSASRVPWSKSTLLVHSSGQITVCWQSSVSKCSCLERIINLFLFIEHIWNLRKWIAHITAIWRINIFLHWHSPH